MSIQLSVCILVLFLMFDSFDCRGIDANQISFLSVTNLKPFYGNDSKLAHL